MLSSPGAVATQSVDGGNTWRPLRGSRQGGVGAFAIDPSNSNRMYAANFQGVYRSLDAGATWEATSLASTTYAIAIDPITPTTLYAASYELGLFLLPNAWGLRADSARAANGSDYGPAACRPAVDLYLKTSEGCTYQSPLKNTASSSVDISCFGS